MYVVTKLNPRTIQMTLEEFLFGDDNYENDFAPSTTSTRVYEVKTVSDRMRKKLNVEDTSKLIAVLKDFNNKTKNLRSIQNRHDLYEHFCIPKKSGGLRHINAPKDELMEALNDLVRIFKVHFKASKLYHTGAFAYIEGRSTLDAVKRHQANESKWFGKYDLHDFFGSTTLDFAMNMISQVYPFSEVCAFPGGKDALRTAIGLGFLDGGLPQGTPLSPMLTNIMMIPIDYELFNKFRKQKLVYTRYSDDFIISSKHEFEWKEIQNEIIDCLKERGADFTINIKKTRYGSSAGSNWNLGVMLNKDNEITVGHKKKRILKATLTSYTLDYKNHIKWSLEDIQILEGTLNYYRNVEKNNIDNLVSNFNKKFNVDVDALIKKGIKSYAKGGNYFE